MPTFLWSGKTISGGEAVERVESETPEAARQILEARGWTDIRQQTTEIHEFSKQQCQADSNPDCRPKLTPKEELAFMRGTAPGLWTLWLRALRDSMGVILALTASLAWALYRHRTMGATISVVLLLVMVFVIPVAILWFGRSSRLFRRLHTAKNWHCWNEVLQCLDKLKNVQRSTRVGIGDASMARYRALALAGLGRLDEAIIHFSEAAEKAEMPQWLYHVQLVGIYDVAKQYDKGIELYRMAMQEATDKTVVWIDMGGCLVERFNRPYEAKQLLEMAENAQLSEIARLHLPSLRGKIAWREKDYTTMDKCMREALAGFERQPPNKYYIFEPSILICRGYLAVSNAALGNKEEARAYFAASGEYLSVIGLDELVAEYHSMM